MPDNKIINLNTLALSLAMLKGIEANIDILNPNFEFGYNPYLIPDKWKNGKGSEQAIDDFFNVNNDVSIGWQSSDSLAYPHLAQKNIVRKNWQASNTQWIFDKTNKWFRKTDGYRYACNEGILIPLKDIHMNTLNITTILDGRGISGSPAYFIQIDVDLWYIDEEGNYSYNFGTYVANKVQTDDSGEDRLKTTSVTIKRDSIKKYNVLCLYGCVGDAKVVKMSAGISTN